MTLLNAILLVTFVRSHHHFCHLFRYCTRGFLATLALLLIDAVLCCACCPVIAWIHLGALCVLSWVWSWVWSWSWFYSVTLSLVHCGGFDLVLYRRPLHDLPVLSSPLRLLPTTLLCSTYSVIVAGACASPSSYTHYISSLVLLSLPVVALFAVTSIFWSCFTAINTSSIPISLFFTPPFFHHLLHINTTLLLFNNTIFITNSIPTTQPVKSLI